MIQTLKNNWLIVMASVAFLLAGLVFQAGALAAPPAAPAVPPEISGQVDCGAGVLQLDIASTDPRCTTATGVNTLNSTITNVINAFSLIVGLVAVVMLVYGGFRYVTSNGDSGNIGNAKNTILYAIVGLVIVAVAQAVVQFVLTKAA